MNRLIAVAGAVAINAGVFGLLIFSAYQSVTPEGSVYVTELPSLDDKPAYAQADNKTANLLAGSLWSLK
jgi:hypothetical protein